MFYKSVQNLMCLYLFVLIFIYSTSAQQELADLKKDFNDLETELEQTALKLIESVKYANNILRNISEICKNETYTEQAEQLVQDFMDFINSGEESNVLLGLQLKSIQSVLQTINLSQQDLDELVKYRDEIKEHLSEEYKNYFEFTGLFMKGLRNIKNDCESSSENGSSINGDVEQIKVKFIQIGKQLEKEAKGLLGQLPILNELLLKLAKQCADKIYIDQAENAGQNFMDFAKLATERYVTFGLKLSATIDVLDTHPLTEQDLDQLDELYTHVEYSINRLISNNKLFIKQFMNIMNIMVNKCTTNNTNHETNNTDFQKQTNELLLKYNKLKKQLEVDIMNLIKLRKNVGEFLKSLTGSCANNEYASKAEITGNILLEIIDNIQQQITVYALQLKSISSVLSDENGRQEILDELEFQYPFISEKVTEGIANDETLLSTYAEKLNSISKKCE